MAKLSLLAASLAPLALLATPAIGGEPSKGDAKLAKMLEGRVAGESERCVRLIGHDRLIVIDGTAVVAKRGDTIWVNRTANPAALDDAARMEIRKASTTHLCERDQLISFRRIESFPNSAFTHDEGAVELEEFVPYRIVG